MKFNNISNSVKGSVKTALVVFISSGETVNVSLT